ncbi:hypothetical protein F2Q70_00017869 [Brassica cretica]|uniref:Uncharacterized protein n=1 Tax=Brassica cretica TaxID=69181 RepID=A0A8S9L095_BRACR|nr:hypothetical protein F2Q70_00017869 [Brassica cretica]KAF2600059.1 hypothetical protein F2Q68_00010842 [Brassica cretica]
MQVFQIWKTPGLEDFQTTSKKTSRRLPGRLPDDFQMTSRKSFQTTSRKSSRRLLGKSSDGVFSHMVLIFHLDMYFVCSIKVCFTDLGLIYMFFRSGSDFGRPMESLLGSLLKYNALEVFRQVFQTTSKKSSRRLPGILLTGSSSISSGV